MTSNQRSTARTHRCFSKLADRGFSLVSAIFLLVILAGLGAAIVSISGVQQMSSALDIQGARAYQAARAGIEWGLYKQLTPPHSCIATTGVLPGTTFIMPSGTTLSGFTVNVVCIRTPGADPAGSLDRWQITSTACNVQPPGGSCTQGVGSNTDIGFVQRVVQVEF